MGRIFITGDLHCENNISCLTTNYFPEGNNLTKDDYVIVCGDFGFLWYDNIFHPGYREQQYWTSWLTNKPWTTLFIDGNHENFDMIYKLPTIDMFGSTVGKVNNSIYHLKRGHVYTIHGKTFWCMGGALSTDRGHSAIDANNSSFWEVRALQKKKKKEVEVDWWKEEIPSREEFEFGLDSLDKVNWKVDYVITHTCPKRIISEMPITYIGDRYNDPVSSYLEIVSEKINCNKWFFGHFHQNFISDHGIYNCNFERIIEI
jgi:hypothetical protein